MGFGRSAMKRDADDQARLHPAAYRRLGWSDTERINFILKDKWIKYDKADSLLSIAERLLQSPDRQRKKWLFIEAKSGNGKTTLIERFYKLHPQVRNDGNLISPVISVECPAGPSIDSLYANILLEINGPIPSGTVAKEIALRKQLSKVQAKILIIDNFHDFRYGNSDLKEKFLAAVRKLATSARLSIVATGTYIARNTISRDPQANSRFRFEDLPLWRNDNGLKDLLFNFERLLPLRKPSNLGGSAELVKQIWRMSEGILGNIEEILQDAAQLAIETGKEHVDLEILKKVPFNTKHENQPLDKSEYPQEHERQ